MKSISIFIKTYANDFKLLVYSLQSLKKYVTGYDSLIILVPKKDALQFIAQIEEHCPVGTVIYPVDEYGNGYLYQQVCKLQAHKYTDADFIMFGDSDLIYDHPINLQDFVADDKPEILYTPWDKVGQAICWKKPTEEFMGEAVEWEHMRRNCLIYHRSTLVAISEYFPNLEHYIMNSGSFSEFNCLGAYAHRYEADKYSFINTDNWEYTRPKSEQLWSYGTPDGDETHQKEYQRSIDTINKALGLNISEL